MIARSRQLLVCARAYSELPGGEHVYLTKLPKPSTQDMKAAAPKTLVAGGIRPAWSIEATTTPPPPIAAPLNAEYTAPAIEKGGC